VLTQYILCRNIERKIEQERKDVLNQLSATLQNIRESMKDHVNNADVIAEKDLLESLSEQVSHLMDVQDKFVKDKGECKY
jgi:fructose-1,6-bisphosphatase/inositol monophosphatase family enzyme